VLAGPSTSSFSGDPPVTVKRLELSESEFLRRLDRRSRSRYNEPFPESLFDDLQKDDLIPALERSENEGLSPKYFATWRHYRRALQLQRLRAVGIKGRDALRVQLFVRGYGLKVSEVRDAIRNELMRGLRELRPQLRSQYFHKAREPGPSHLAAVERQLGAIDPRFEAAGLKLPTKFYLDKVRFGFGAVSRSGLAEMEGLFLTGLDDRPLPKRVNDALNGSDDEYVSARAALTWIERTMFRRVVGRNVIDSPNWSTHLLVIILVLQHAKKSAGGFTVANILTKIPFRDGFDRLARDLGSKMAGSGEGASGTPEHDGGSKRIEKDRDH
jgi:hypothetical protein